MAGTDIVPGMAQLQLLIKRQEEELPDAITELETYGKKSTHWIWWAFPTNKEGDSEPTGDDGMKTKVTKETAPLLLHHDTPVWQNFLKLICNLSEKNGISQTIPNISDIGRIKHFITFWKSIQSKPLWLTDALTCLEEALLKSNRRREIKDAPMSGVFSDPKYLLGAGALGLGTAYYLRKYYRRRRRTDPDYVYDATTLEENDTPMSFACAARLSDALGVPGVEWGALSATVLVLVEKMKSLEQEYYPN